VTVVAREASAARLSPRVIVRWRRIENSTESDRLEVARGVAEIVLGDAQRPSTAPVVLAPSARDALWRTAQARKPISYREAAERIAAIQLTDDRAGVVRALGEHGSILYEKRTVPVLERPKLGVMGEPAARKRGPMRLNRRPGRGGIRRTSQDIDPAEGLDEYGKTRWSSVPGARVGTLEFDPTGDAVILCRLSSEERDDRFVDQLRPCLALAGQHGLKVRVALIAENMSGTREVRPERAFAPPPGVLERDDMLLLDEYIAEGWVRHIIARGGDRIAREILPGETLLTRWAKNGIGLWLADLGRRVDYTANSGDRMMVRTMMMISAEERAAIVRRLQTAALNKGPLAGNGHLGPTRFGFVRDPKTRRLRPDPEQWPWILRAFELADAGAELDGEGLSTRKVAEQLASEGCPFDHDRIRKILQDPIYATGEFVSRVRGIAIAQRPIGLDDPVPIDRFTRVQQRLALRKGRSSRTPLGEFLFNYVPTVHLQCEHESAKPRTLIKGSISARDRGTTRRYRHAYRTPECCRGRGRGPNGGFVWDRDLLERPVIEAIRTLSTDPDVLSALASATRHERSSSSPRLTEAQRAEIEHSIRDLEERRARAVDRWIDGRRDVEQGLAAYERLMEGFDRHIAQLENRLEADRKASEIEARSDDRRLAARTESLLDLLTVEVPTDPTHRQLRARLFQKIVSRIVIDDSGNGPIRITIEGHLVPDDAGVEEHPAHVAGDLLDGYAAMRQGKAPDPDRQLAAAEEAIHSVETDLSAKADKSVSITAGQALSMPSSAQLARLKRASLASTSWRLCQGRRGVSGRPCWRVELEVNAEDGHHARE
jgi:DNA invertase Pin-like site-specific DNA recombinase